MKVTQQLETLAEIAEGQGGLFTTSQADRRRVSRLQLQRAARSGMIERVAHGVYRMAGAPSGEFERLRAAWLAMEPSRTAEERLDDTPPRGVVAGSTAAWMFGAGDLDPVPYEIAVSDRMRSRREDVRFHRRALDPSEVTTRHGLPVTTFERTIADLILRDIDPDHLERIIEARSIDFRKVAAYVGDGPVRRRTRARAVLDRLERHRIDFALEGMGRESSLARQAALDIVRPTIEPMRDLVADLGAAALSKSVKEQLADLGAAALSKSVKEQLADLGAAALSKSYAERPRPEGA